MLKILDNITPIELIIAAVVFAGCYFFGKIFIIFVVIVVVVGLFTITNKPRKENGNKRT